MSIRISQEIIVAMMTQAEAVYPAESCGLIVGESRQDDSCDDDSREAESHAHYYLPFENDRRDNSERRFLIDPIIYQMAEDRADSEGLAIVSVVHSHPDHPDRPSEFDRTHAWPGLSYIIIAVRAGRAVSYRSWRLTENRERFEEESILV